MRIQFTLPAEWERIAHVRHAITRSVIAVYGDPTLAHDLSMTAAELLENGVKYGAKAPLGLIVVEEGDDVVVRVSNGIEPNSPNRGALLARLRWIHSFKDPAEAYIAALNEVAESNQHERASSGLGLVRIISEGGCRVSCEVANPTEIVIIARRSLAPSPQFADQSRELGA